MYGWDERQRGNRHQRGYGYLWYRIRDRILKRDNYLCQPCENNHRITTASEVDHILPKAKGGTDDDDNLQSICKKCHAEKTITDKGNKCRDISCDINGIPCNNSHRWHKNE
jgi:5-methylcytosine-specific restriction protein A